MLDRNSAEQLVLLISDDRNTLSSIYKSFCSFLEATKVLSLTTLGFMMESNLLTSQQTVISLWILYSESRNSPLPENEFSIVYSSLFLQAKENSSSIHQNIAILLQMILSNESIDFISSKTALSFLSMKLSPPKSTDIYISQGTDQIYRSIFVVNNEFNLKSKPTLTTDALIEIMTSPNLFSEPQFGPDNIAPPLFPIQTDELSSTYIADYDPPFLFDDAPKSMIYEPVESIIIRMNVDKLKRREADIVLEAIKTNLSLVRFLWDDKIRAQDFIEINKSAASKIYCYISSIDQSIFDTLLVFEVTRPVMSVIRDMILEGNFPSNFVENMTDVILEKLKRSDKKELLETRASAFFGMMCELISQKVSFSDYVIGEIRDFLEEGKVNDVVEAQDLFTFLTET